MKNKLFLKAFISLLLSLSLLVSFATPALAEPSSKSVIVGVSYHVYHEMGDILGASPDDDDIRQHITDYLSQLDSFSIALRSPSGKHVELSRFAKEKVSMDSVRMEYFEWENMPGLDDAYSILTDELSGIKYEIVSVPIPAGYEFRQYAIGVTQSQYSSDSGDIGIFVYLSPIGSEPNSESQKPERMVDDDDEAREHPSPWANVLVSAGIGGKLVPKQLQEKYTQVITRAEFCSLAVRAYEKANGEITGRKSFSDTNDIDVEKMSYLGVVSGANTEGTLFKPDDQLTREQAAVILSRLASAVGKPFSGSSEATQRTFYSDDAMISPWAVGSVSQMWQVGLMEGVGNNMFAPQEPYTREQGIVTIVKLYLNTRNS